MLLTVKKEVEETIEVKTPCWLYQKSPERWHFINENGDMTTVGNGVIIIWAVDSDDGVIVQREIQRVIAISHSCIEADFKQALDRELYKIQETVTA